MLAVMNYQHPELQKRLAAEYVLGSLQGKARLRFERLMVEQPSLRRLVTAWEQRLAPLSNQLAPVPVPPAVWQTIRQRLGFIVVEQKPVSKPFWLTWAWGGSLLASAVAGVLVWNTLIYQPDVIPSYKDLAVLSTDKAEPTWIVRVNADSSALQLSSLQQVSVPSDRDLELWAIADGAPESLGVIKLSQGQGSLTFTAQQRQRLRSGKVLAISIEPKGGSTTGSPTGAVLFTGKISV
jgi:anti-sigma-K factor RskA